MIYIILFHISDRKRIYHNYLHATFITECHKISAMKRNPLALIVIHIGKGQLLNFI